MYCFGSAYAAVPVTDFVTPRLALMPSGLLDADGFYVYRGPTSGRVLRHRSTLVLGLVATLESRPGLVDVLAFDDVLLGDGPVWGEQIAERLDGDMSPDVLVRAVITGREFFQAVSVPGDRSSTRADQEAMRVSYRERGLSWGIVTGQHIDPYVASAWLWVGEAVRRGAPAAAILAVAHSIRDADGHETVADMLLDAAVTAGVPVATAADALGCLIARREVDVDLADGIVDTDRPLARSSGLYPVEIRDAWRTSIGRSLPQNASEMA